MTNNWTIIWQDFKKGSNRAFETIYYQHIDVLYRYGSKITSDKDLVKDCIQQLFLELYTSKGKLTDPENLEFYLLKSLKHILMRKISMEKRTSLFENDKAGFQIEPDVENKWITSEQEQLKIDLLNEALQSLEPAKKELLFLKFYSGLTNQQIGSLTGQRPETVQKQIYRILRTLQVTFVERFLEFFHMFFISN